MSATVDRLAYVGLALLALAGCAKQDAPVSHAEVAAAQNEPSIATATDPLGELARLEQRMRVLGLEPAASRRTVEQKAADDAPTREAVELEESSERGIKRDGQSATLAPPPSEHPSPSQPVTMGADCEGESRCATLCELSEAICQLEVQICSMAEDHEGDPIYVDACERAVEDCELSGDACNQCVE